MLVEKPILHKVAGKRLFHTECYRTFDLPNYTLAISMHRNARSNGNQARFLCVSSGGFVGRNVDYVKAIRMLRL
jgi:hypothetical protein